MTPVAPCIVNDVSYVTHTFWSGWTMTPVAPRIVTDVSYMTRYIPVCLVHSENLRNVSSIAPFSIAMSVDRTSKLLLRNVDFYCFSLERPFRLSGSTNLLLCLLRECNTCGG